MWSPVIFSILSPMLIPASFHLRKTSKGKYAQLITFVDGLCTIGYRGVVLRFWFGHDIGMIPLPLQPIFPFIWNNYILSFFKTYETFPVEIVRAQAREHLTHARARCASTDRRARETREQIEARARRARARPTVRHARAQISSPKVDLVSLFAIWRAYLRARRAYLRARVGRARARTRARILALLANLARASLFARASRARACRCSRTC